MEQVEITALNIHNLTFINFLYEVWLRVLRDLIIIGSLQATHRKVGSITVHARGSDLLNTLRPRQKGRYIADEIFKCIFFNENVWISIKFHWSLFLMIQLTIIRHWFR